MVERIVVGQMSTNSYIYSEWRKECIVIDPGGDFEKILSHMAIKNLKPRGIVCTHGHLDHISAAGAIARHYESEELHVPVAIHEKDREYLGKKAEKAHLKSFSGLTSGPEEIFSVFGDDFANADIILEEGDTVFDSTLTVIHTPGHTQGSICLYSESMGVLFSGDTLFFEGVGRTDLHKGDSRALLKSIREKLFTLPEETRVFPGHGPNTTLEREIKNNPFVNE
ncbi:MAG: MBL fold metallo-hydrolase [Spirochaetales bacterium]|nr:MBL fold metallo-hydrolase [Spirochaetales bacterium]